MVGIGHVSALNRAARVIAGAFVIVATAFAVGAYAQPARSYTARLSPVPIDIPMMATIAGSGQITASIKGQSIEFAGTFEGLRSPATTVMLHKALRGTHGPVIATLQATSDSNGRISGTVPATPQLLQDLDRTLIYVQLQSEKAPDGNLWGWLFLQDTRR